MVFSAGNLIVLTIVVIVLVVYRQIDRNNRSLEKVKRYADRVQDELDEIVEQKAIAIKDMGIELEVHQKAAREVLKRVQTIEEGLSKRATEIENIGERIGDYDTALSELLRMTKRAEENLERVRSESDYVEKVGKRIKQSQSQLTDLEKRIPGLTEQFSELNAAQLESATQRAFEHAETEAESVRAEVTDLSDRLHEFGRRSGTATGGCSAHRRARRRITGCTGGRDARKRVGAPRGGGSGLRRQTLLDCGGGQAARDRCTGGALVAFRF
jgi:chromosome segregation ATPase